MMSSEEPNNKCNLIVNYLPQTLTDEEFRTMFVTIGPIKQCKIVRDRSTGYSYGFGFVEYVNEADARKAISFLNGLPLQNKTLKVAFARPSGESIKNANLYVRNLPKAMTAKELEDQFAPYGRIIQTRVLTDQFTGASKGIGFVLFDQRDQAENAMQAMDGQSLPMSKEPLSVKFAEDNRGKARPPPMHLVNHITVNRNRPSNSGYSNSYGNEGFGGPMRSQGGGQRHRFNPMNNNNYSNNSNSSANGDGFIIFVYNIGTDAVESTLWQLFSPFGQVQKVNVMRDYGNKCCKGFGFVTMGNYHEALNAIQSLNGYRFAGKPLQVSFKTPRG